MKTAKEKSKEKFYEIFEALLKEPEFMQVLDEEMWLQDKKISFIIANTS